MRIHRIQTGPWRENCYVVHHGDSTAVVIDPGDDYQVIIDYLTDTETEVRAILNTHGHVDHIGAVSKLVKEYQVPFFLHSADASLVKSANVYALAFGKYTAIDIPVIDQLVENHPNGIELGSFRYEIVETPGHTEGSICYLINECLFSGDTVFPTKAGRTDLPGGDPVKLRQSLSKLFELDRHIEIYPGHGRSTTVEEIIANEVESTIDVK